MHKRRIIKHTTIEDGGLYGHVPARPGFTTPQIRWTCVHPAVKRDTSPCIFGLSKIPDFERGTSLPEAVKLQTPPRDDALVLLLSFGSANTWREDLHLTSYVPCLAHTTSITGSKKQSEERAALFDVRVHAIVIFSFYSQQHLANE